MRTLPGRAPSLGMWAVPLPTIDPQIILRSRPGARPLRPRLRVRPLRRGQAPAGRARGHGRRGRDLRGGAAAADAQAAARTTPARRRPRPSARAKGWFKVRFVGEGGGARVETEVSGGDPGYGDTSKMLAESALCLAHDDLPPSAGQVTTAQAMGEALIERLRAVGLGFDVVNQT